MQRLSAIIATQNELVAADLELESVMRLVAERAAELTDAAGAVVEMADGEDLIYRAAMGIAAPSLGTRIPLSNSLAGRSVLMGQVLRCEDSEQDDRVNREACRRVGIRSMVVVPLRHGGHTVGVLKVVGSVPNAFDEEDVEVLELMAGLIAAAIARAAEFEAKQALVSAREAAARALEEKNAVLQTFFEATPLLMGTVQKEGRDYRYLSVNPAMGALLGSTPERMVGRLASEMGVAPEVLEASLAPFDQAERTGEPVRWEYSRTLEGAVRHMAAIAHVLPQSGVEPHRRFCFVVQDVTEQLHLRQQLDLSSRMASVGQLAAGVAHEANNPLAYMLANVEYVRQELSEREGLLAPELHADLLKALNEAREGGARVKQIIRDLYTFVRADTETLAMVQLQPMIERSLAMGAHEVRNRARLVTDFSGPPAVRGNEARLGQVVLNLVVNAAHAMPQGRPSGENEIRVATGSLDGNRAFIEVRDNGSGMPPEVVARIFEPFFTTKAVGQGMGLGLSICHNIIKAHGGELTVESAAGVGTTFRVALPETA